MSMTGPYVFRRAETADLPLIGRWLGERHVAKWWGRSGEEIAEIARHVAGDDTVPLVVVHEARPIGYLQWYPATSDGELPEQPEGTRGIDFLIGEPEALGKGHGAAFLKQFVDEAHHENVARLVADPDGRNISSVGCLGRAGFEPVRLIGPAGARRLLMARDIHYKPAAPSRGERPSRRRRRET